ncbi:MAG: PepSY domain-containing protein [Filimonas sp.]|nr:PepSY domain-containing protein [Filimonas sp.]
MALKKWIGKIHLWLGLASGLIVVFLGITGCILAFQREIESVTVPYQNVQPQHAAMLPPSEITKIANAHLPGKQPHSIAYGVKNKAAQAIYYGEDYYYIIYVNPYNGQVLKVRNMNRDFFRIMINGHFYLWLPPTIGQPIVATATLIFLIMLITGIVLWWPRNKAARKQRFSIKWNAKWKRVNYDLHNVLGFYMTWIAIFIAVTGLVWGFQWFANSIYWTASGGKKMIQWEESYSDKKNIALKSAAPAIDLIWQKMTQENPAAQVIEVHPPTSDSASIEAVANPDETTYWKSDYRYFDQYTLQEMPVRHLYSRFSKATAADKIMRLNYDVHTGAVWGIAGKIMVFCASLVAASLPITGFLIWRGRRKKKKKMA